MKLMEAPSARRWTLSKRDVVRMLMAMDRYGVNSVIIKTEPDYFNWEIPQTGKRKVIRGL